MHQKNSYLLIIDKTSFKYIVNKDEFWLLIIDFDLYKSLFRNFKASEKLGK